MVLSILTESVIKHTFRSRYSFINSKKLFSNLTVIMNSGDDYRQHKGSRGGYRSFHGHRGNRRGGRGHDRGDRWQRGEGQSRSYGNEADGGSARGGVRPPGLRGKDIGMWYAKRSKAKQQKWEQDTRSEVKVDGQDEHNLRKLLHDIRTSRDCPPQPCRSGAAVTVSDSDDSQGDVTEGPDIMGQEDFSPMDIPSSSLARPSTSASQDNELESDDAKQIEVAMETDDSLMIHLDDGLILGDEEVTMPGEEEVSSERLSEELLDDYEEKQENTAYQHMQTFRQKLPSYKTKQKILDLISSNQVVVLSGETGCGKTTQVPQYILDDYIQKNKGAECRIICTQPRRISAISMAERVAAERAEKCGYSVGYLIRLENKLPRNNGSILYCTTGILLKLLENDRLLKRATHIILDEIHERDLLSDFLIIILKDILAQRPELKLILMSATLNAEQFSQYYNNCPMVNIPGFTYPVTEYLLEDVIELLRYRVPERMMKKRAPRGGRKKMEMMEEQEYQDVWLRNLEGGVNCHKRYSRDTIHALRCLDTNEIDKDLILELIRYIVRNKRDGAILVFVPGWAEISDLNKMLQADRMFNSASCKIIPLHSMMPTLNQREVFDRPPAGVRKIVLATNIAETSITIDDVVYVIDCGKIKVSSFTAENNLSTLAPQLVSKANARQRRGRAGRVQPGECYHLYTGLQESLMMDYLPPEILRKNLEELCLQIKLLNFGSIIPFVTKALDKPSLAAVRLAIGNLQDLNALDADENLLPLGKHLARMPLDPHTGKMILFGAMFNCLGPILTIASALNFKEPFYIPLGKEREADQARLRLAEGCHSDHIMLVKAYEKWERAVKRGTNHSFCWDNFMAEATLRMLKKMRVQLAEVLYDLGFLRFKSPDQVKANTNSDNTALIKAIVCAGVYPNVAKISKPPSAHRQMKFQLKDFSKCELHPKSVVKAVTTPATQWVVYHKKMKTSSVFLYDCSIVSPFSLLFFGGSIRQTLEDGMELVTVDDWIKFKASSKTVQLVKELRKELDVILEEKIQNSHHTSWGSKSKEGALIGAIIDLVTTEDVNFQVKQSVASSGSSGGKWR